MAGDLTGSDRGPEDPTAVVLCGGRGTRLDCDAEKPLVEVGGRPMVDRVLSALAASRVEDVVAVTSPHAPATAAHVDCPTVAAPGEGYVADLNYALDRVDPPVLTVAADLPLLDGAAVDLVLDAYAGRSLATYVPAERKRSLGVSVDATLERDGRELVPAGINVVDGGQTGDDAGERTADDERASEEGREPGSEDTFITRDRRLAVNVNRIEDRRVAESILECR